MLSVELKVSQEPGTSHYFPTSSEAIEAPGPSVVTPTATVRNSEVSNIAVPTAASSTIKVTSSVTIVSSSTTCISTTSTDTDLQTAPGVEDTSDGSCALPIAAVTVIPPPPPSLCAVDDSDTITIINTALPHSPQNPTAANYEVPGSPNLESPSISPCESEDLLTKDDTDPVVYNLSSSLHFFHQKESKPETMVQRATFPRQVND